MAKENIHERVELGPEVELGRAVVLEEGVVVGPRCRLGHGVVVRKDTVLEADCVIGEYSVLGADPVRAEGDQDLAGSAVKVGAGTVTGVGVTLHRGVLLGGRNVLEDRVVIGSGSRLGAGSWVGAGSIVGVGCVIGEDVRVESMVLLAGYSKIGNRCTIAPFVATSNDNSLGRRRGNEEKSPEAVTVEKGGRLGLGAVVLGGKTVGEDSFVAAGALVTRDVPPKMMVRGVPAKIWKPVPTPELLEKQRGGKMTGAKRKL